MDDIDAVSGATIVVGIAVIVYLIYTYLNAAPDPSTPAGAASQLATTVINAANDTTEAVGNAAASFVGAAPAGGGTGGSGSVSGSIWTDTVNLAESIF
jgi:hypothetical protein